MKKLIVVFLITLFCLNVQAQKAKKYAVESGYLKIEMTGDTKGTKEIWWDDYGTKTCELEKSTTTTSVLGFSSTEKKHMLTIIVKDQYWVVNYIKNSGTKGKIPYYNDAQDMSKDMTKQQKEKLAESLLNNMGDKKEGTENIKGYKCDIFSIMGVKSWVYKGIILKIDGSVLGVESKEMFTEFKPNSSVSASKFKAPTNFTYKNLSEKMGNYSAAMEKNEEEENDDDTPKVPVNYSYDKFKKVINGFSHKSYVCMGTNSMDGLYAATFLKGMNSLMIVAESRKNTEKSEHDSYEQFNHNGHKCYYGKIEDEDGTAIVIEYSKYDMYVVVAAMPNMNKKELLKIVDKLNF